MRLHIPAFLAERDKPLTCKLARFGINLPAASGKKRPPLLNARTDTLRRGSFKSMLANRRCVIPAEGFYEWREEDGLKQPYFFARKDDKPLMFVGIWDYSDVKGDVVPSFAILTDEPNALVAPHASRATRSYALLQVPEALSATEEDLIDRCAREAARLRVGLITFSSATEFETWETKLRHHGLTPRRKHWTNLSATFQIRQKNASHNGNKQQGPCHPLGRRG
jgi:SOS response associated peptidase (SRAP)